MLLGAPVVAEPTLLGGLALFMVLPILDVVLLFIVVSPVAGAALVVAALVAGATVFAVPLVAGAAVLGMVVPGAGAAPLAAGLPLLPTPLFALEPSIAADVTGVAVLGAVVTGAAP